MDALAAATVLTCVSAQIRPGMAGRSCAVLPAVDMLRRRVLPPIRALYGSTADGPWQR